MPSNRQKTRYLLSFAYGLGCLALLAVALVTFSSSNRFVKSANRFESATREIQLASDTEAVLTRAESEQTRYLVTQNSAYLTAFNTDSLDFLMKIRLLHKAAQGSPKLEKTVDVVESLGTNRLTEMHRVISTYQSNGFQSALRMMRTEPTGKK